MYRYTSGSSSGGNQATAHCNSCCGQFGPITTQCGYYTPGGNTWLDRDMSVPLTQQRCRLLEESEDACGWIWHCMKKVEREISSKCYVYRAFFGARNSNTVAFSILWRCVGSGRIPLPRGIKAPGWRPFRPDDKQCLKQP